MKIRNIGKVTYIICKNTNEAIEECEFRIKKPEFRYLNSLSNEINENSFPWIKSETPAFEAQLVEFPIHPYLGELDQEKFALPRDFQHGNHTHIMSYHKSLPENQRLGKPITAAGALGH